MHVALRTALLVDFGFEPPEGPADLKASFRVGYDAGENLLYVAVVARDDVRVIGPEKWSDSIWEYLYQYFCAIYIDADHSGDDAASVRQSDAKVAQTYAMVAGPSQLSPDADGNPVLNRGDTRSSGLNAAYLRLGEYTVYEWAIPLWSSFPDQRYSIELGATIGFGIDVMDADAEGGRHWMAWTSGKREMADPDHFGDLAFVDAYDAEVHPLLPTAPPVDYGAPGSAVVRLVQVGTDEPLGGRQVRLLQDG